MNNSILIKTIRSSAGKRAVSVIGAGAILALLVFVAIGSVQAAGAGEAEKSYGPIGFIFNFLNKNRHLHYIQGNHHYDFQDQYQCYTR